MAVCGNQIDIRDDDRNRKAVLVTTKWLIKTSTVTIDVRGYSDEIYDCVSWPEWFDADTDLVRLQLTAHDPHFTLGDQHQRHGMRDDGHRLAHATLVVQEQRVG